MNNEYLHFFCKNRVSTLYFGTDDVAYACITPSTRLTRIVSYEEACYVKNTKFTG